MVTSDSLTPNAFTLIRTQPGLRAGTEHDLDVIADADHVIDLGPGSVTGRYLREALAPAARSAR
ncbi:hypothetical protein [Streptomyces sp. NPDC127098]|uniref:hypothetical protein n=1 Tax=Streptomyces sp. NPDC127098 TaxID=3347137 RepID=UPI003658C0BF